MNIFRIIAFLLSDKEIQFVKTIELLNLQLRVQKAIHKEKRKMKPEERRAIGKLAYDLRRLLRLGTIETIFKPETLIRWFERFANRKYDSSKSKRVGRPPISDDQINLIIKIAIENKTWGADRIAGQMNNLGYKVSDQSVLNILKKNGIPTGPKTKMSISWETFLKAHWDQIWACDFFHKAILTSSGIKIFKVFVFIQYSTRKVKIIGMEENPDGEWMAQMARNITDVFEPMLVDCKYLIHDADKLYTKQFKRYLKKSGIRTKKIPPRSPNLNPFAERVIRSIKEECLDHLIIIGENNLRRIMKEYTEHYHYERNHQGIGNQIIESENEILQHSKKGRGEILCKERVGGLLKYYYRKKVA